MPDWGDKFGEVVGGGYDKLREGVDWGKEKLGEGVNWTTDKVGDGLERVGLEEAGDAVKDWGDGPHDLDQALVPVDDVPLRLGDQARSGAGVLAIDIAREGFEWALGHAFLSHFDRTRFDTEAAWREALRRDPVRVQWDPARDLRLDPLPHRAIRIGLSGETVGLYVDDWISAVRDVTWLAHEVHAAVTAGEHGAATALLPPERACPLPPFSWIGSVGTEASRQEVAPVWRAPRERCQLRPVQWWSPSHALPQPPALAVAGSRVARVRRPAGARFCAAGRWWSALPDLMSRMRWRRASWVSVRGLSSWPRRAM